MSTSTITRDDVVFALVNTTNNPDAPAGHVVITANLREVKGTIVKPEEKHRNVIIPEFTCPDGVDKKFQPVLLDSFYKLAKNYLEDQMSDSKRMLREIPLSAFSIDSLLTYFSTVAASTRLTSESVAAWFDASATGKGIVEKITAKCNGDKGKTAAMVKVYRDMFIKSASPNHGIIPQECTVLLSLLNEADKESNVYETLATRWAATVEKAQTVRIEAL